MCVLVSPLNASTDVHCSLLSLEEVYSFAVHSSKRDVSQQSVKTMVYGSLTRQVYVFVNSGASSRYSAGVTRASELALAP